MLRLILIILSLGICALTALALRDGLTGAAHGFIPGGALFGFVIGFSVNMKDPRLWSAKNGLSLL